MPAVSNTSPILNLAIIDYLFLMREQFGQLFIPPAVLHELRIEEDLPGSRAVYVEGSRFQVEERSTCSLPA